MNKKYEQPTKEQAQQWANALRSGKYKQSFMLMQSYSGYCCLGVACDFFIHKSKIKYKNGFISGILPYYQPNAPDWLKTISDDLLLKIGISFVTLNDNNKYSFNEIADIIELVYIHRALD